MHTVQLERMFAEVRFHKVGHEIAEKARLKIDALQAKITEREGRIAQLCSDHHLSPSDLFAVAQAQSENEHRRPACSAPVRDIPAGVATAITRESQQLESERAQVRTLGLLMRNIDSTTPHELSFSELEYLAF
jgi:predicted DNA-binding ribbon-helix-helix protein